MPGSPFQSAFPLANLCTHLDLSAKLCEEGEHSSFHDADLKSKLSSEVKERLQWMKEKQYADFLV